MLIVHFSDTHLGRVISQSIDVYSRPIIPFYSDFEPGIYDSLLLEFAVAHKPTQLPWPDQGLNLGMGIIYSILVDL